MWYTTHTTYDNVNIIMSRLRLECMTSCDIPQALLQAFESPRGGVILTLTSPQENTRLWGAQLSAARPYLPQIARNRRIRPSKLASCAMKQSLDSNMGGLKPTLLYKCLNTRKKLTTEKTTPFPNQKDTERPDRIRPWPGTVTWNCHYCGLLLFAPRILEAMRAQKTK